MKNLNVFTKNRLGVLMLFTLLTFVFSSFRITSNTKPRKKLRITKVQNPIEGEGPSISGEAHISFSPDYQTNFNCIDGLIYEVENATNTTLYNVEVTLGQGSLTPTTINVSHISPGSTRVLNFGAHPTNKSTSFDVFVNVPNQYGGQKFSEIFYATSVGCKEPSGETSRN